MRVCLKNQDTSAKFMCVFLKSLGAASGLHFFETFKEKMATRKAS